MQPYNLISMVTVFIAIRALFQYNVLDAKRVMVEEDEAAVRVKERLAREACSGFPLVKYKCI